MCDIADLEIGKYDFLKTSAWIEKKLKNRGSLEWILRDGAVKIF